MLTKPLDRSMRTDGCFPWGRELIGADFSRFSVQSAAGYSDSIKNDE